MTNKQLIINGSIIFTLGLGLIVISGITAIASKLLIIGGITATGYGIYKSFGPVNG